MTVDQQLNKNNEPNRKDIESIEFLISKNKIDEADINIQTLVEKFPKSFLVTNLYGIVLTNKKKFKEAKTCFKNSININSNFAEAHFNLGLLLNILNKTNEAIISFNNAINLRHNYYQAHSSLGNVLSKSGKLQEAVNSYECAISIKPDYLIALNNLANALKDLGRSEEALAIYEIALKISPKHPEILNNLGNALREMERFGEAVSNYKLALKIVPNHSEIHNNLGKALVELGDLTSAIKHFENSNNINAKAQILESFYKLKKYTEYHRTLEQFTISNPNNIRIASISAFVSDQLDVENPYPFCKNPLEFLSTNNSLSLLDNSKNFIAELITNVNVLPFVKNLKNTTTTNGYQTVGNLFSYNINSLSIFENIIRKQIQLYKSKFSKKKCGLISNWPKNILLTSWCVKLLKSGYQESHIHPSGWLSGVFYLKIPETVSNKKEGSIEFSLHGYKYSMLKSNTKKLIYHPNVGDLIIFPSSLFHRTIPFDSKEERISIAFDMMPM